MSRLTENIANHPLARFADFRRLFFAKLVSATGDKFFTLALAWWVVSSGRPGSKTELGLLMAASMLPVVLFGPLWGTAADRFSRKHCMMTADLARFAVISALCVLVWAGKLSMPVLYCLCFAAFSFVPLFEAAASSSLLALTDEKNLSRATAADGSITQFSAVLGGLLGGVMLAATGVLGAFIFNALSFLASFIFVAGMKTRALPPADAQTPHYLADLRAGFAYIFSEKKILWLMAIFAGVNFFSAPLLLLIPLIVKFRLGLGPSWLAWFETALALGSAAMLTVLSLKSRFSGFYKTLFASILAFGLCFAALALTQNRFVCAALLFAAGAALAAGNAAAMILFQHTVPDEMKGRFFAVLTTAAYAVIPLTFAINGAAADIFPLSAVILFNGAASAVLSLLVWAAPKLAEP